MYMIKYKEYLFYFSPQLFNVSQSKPLTAKQEKELSEFIAKRKQEIKTKSKKGTYTQHKI